MLDSNTQNCMLTNDWYQIELLILDSNTWNHLTVWQTNDLQLVLKYSYEII